MGKICEDCGDERPDELMRRIEHRAVGARVGGVKAAPIVEYVCDSCIEQRKQDWKAQRE